MRVVGQSLLFALGLFPLSILCANDVLRRACDGVHRAYFGSINTLLVEDSWFIDVDTTGTTSHGGVFRVQNLAWTQITSTTFVRCRCRLSDANEDRQWGGGGFFDETDLSITRCCAIECSAFAGQFVGAFGGNGNAASRTGENTFMANCTTLLLCGAAGNATGFQGGIHFEEYNAQFKELNFTRGVVSEFGAAFVATNTPGTFTCSYLTVFNNSGESIVHSVRAHPANISDSNFFQNELSGEWFGTIYVETHGLRLENCILNNKEDHPDLGWSSKPSVPFVVINCVFKTYEVPTSMISGAGNVYQSVTASLTLPDEIPDLCANYATGCLTLSRSPSPTTSHSRTPTLTVRMSRTRPPASATRTVRQSRTVTWSARTTRLGTEPRTPRATSPQSPLASGTPEMTASPSEKASALPSSQLPSGAPVPASEKATASSGGAAVASATFDLANPSKSPGGYPSKSSDGYPSKSPGGYPSRTSGGFPDGGGTIEATPTSTAAPAAQAGKVQTVSGFAIIGIIVALATIAAAAFGIWWIARKKAESTGGSLAEPLDQAIGTSATYESEDPLGQFENPLTCLGGNGTEEWTSEVAETVAPTVAEPRE